MAGNYTYNSDVYLLNGIDIETMGAFVEYTRGFLALPERKMPTSFDWPDEQGVDYDLNNVFFKDRTADLSLIVTGSSYEQVLNRLETIYDEFKKPGLQYLKIANTAKINLVAALEGSEPEKLTAHDSPLCAVRTIVKLREPYVLTRQFAAELSDSGSVSLTINAATKPIVIDWGDKRQTKHKGTATLSHTYIDAGIYCIVVYGSVDWVGNITPTGAAEVIYQQSAGLVSGGTWNDDRMWNDEQAWKD